MPRNTIIITPFNFYPFHCLHEDDHKSGRNMSEVNILYRSPISIVSSLLVLLFYIYVYIYIYICVYVCVCVGVCVCVCVCVYIYIYIYITFSTKVLDD